MDASARLTSKGQITIPKAVRDALGLRTGDALLFHVENSVATISRTPDLMELAGSVAVPDDVRGLPWDEVRRRARAAR